MLPRQTCIHRLSHFTAPTLVGLVPLKPSVTFTSVQCPIRCSEHCRRLSVTRLPCCHSRPPRSRIIIHPVYRSLPHRARILTRAVTRLLPLQAQLLCAL